MPTNRYDTFAIFRQQRNLQPMSLGGHQFWCNPTGFKITTERIHADQPSLLGVVRFSWSVKPYIIELVGFTGRGGVDELDNQHHGLRPFRPYFGTDDTRLQWIFPARALSMFVYVDYFDDSMDNTNPNVFSYDIRLSSYPPEIPNYQTIIAPNLPLPSATNQNWFGSGGTSGQGKQ